MSSLHHPEPLLPLTHPSFASSPLAWGQVRAQRDGRTGRCRWADSTQTTAQAVGEALGGGERDSLVLGQANVQPAIEDILEVDPCTDQVGYNHILVAVSSNRVIVDV